MKKLIAVALAMLMLLASAACAETVDVFTLSDPYLELTQGGQTMTVDMAGLQLQLSAGMSGQVPTVQIDVTNGEEELLGAVMQIQDGRILLDVDGVSNTYSIAMPAEMAGQAQQGYDMLFENVAALHSLKLPAIPGVAIPKLDIVTPLSMLLTEAGSDGDAQLYSFSLPYTMINQILAQVAPMIEEMASNVPNISQITGSLSQLADSNSGVTIEGKVTDSAESTDLVAEFYPVQDGQQAAEAVGALMFSTAQNELAIEADMYQGAQNVRLGYVGLTSEPDDKTITLNINVMDQLTFDVAVYPEEDLQAIAADLEAAGQNISLYFAYGNADGEDVAMFNATMPDVFDLNVSESTVEDADGNKAGDLYVSAQAAGSQFDLSAAVTDVLADAQLRSVSDAANAIELTTLTEEQSQQFSSELQNALGGVMAYLNSLEAQPAA